MTSLKTKALSGMVWSGIERFATQGVQFVLQIVLARLLMPEDYGIIALLAVFLAVGQTFIDSGFSRALIQKNSCTENDYTTTFIFNVVVGVVAFVLLYIGAGAIARFYNVALLAPIAQAMGVVFICNSLCIVQQAMLTIQLDFKRQAVVSLVSVVVAGGVAVYMAYRGMGAWCIAVQAIVQSAMRCLLFWILCAWWPKGRFDKAAFNRLFHYGSKLLASGLINTVYQNVYTLFIGKIFAPQILGYFSRAKHFTGLPANSLMGTMQRVVFPILSKVKEDEGELKKKYIIFLRLASAVVFPAMVGLACVARPLVIAMITEKWAPVIPLLQVLCLSSMWLPLHVVNLSLLEVKGRTDLFLKVEVIKKTIGIGILLVTMSLGNILYVCYGLVVASVVSLVVNMYYSDKLMQLGFWKQINELKGIIVACLWMVVCIVGWHWMIQWSNVWVVLFSDIVVGMLGYIACHLVMHTKEVAFVKQLIEEKRKRM